MRNFRVIFSVSLAMVLWGTTFVVFKFSNLSLEPISIIFFRLLISVAFLFGFARLTGRLMTIDRKDFIWFFLLALFEPFFYFLGESFGLTLVSSTLAAVIIATIPLVVPVAAYIFYREKLTLLNIAGLFVSFGGVVMVVIATDRNVAANVKGILLMFLAVIAATGYTLFAKRLLQKYNGMTITAWQSLLGALFFLPLFIIIDLPDLDFVTILPESIWATVYLGVFGSSIAFILFATGIRELGASKSNVYANLVPVVTAIISFFVLKEAMPLLKILGIAIVLAGLLMTQLGIPNGRNGVRRWRRWFFMPRI